MSFDLPLALRLRDWLVVALLEGGREEPLNVLECDASGLWYAEREVG